MVRIARKSYLLCDVWSNYSSIKRVNGFESYYCAAKLIPPIHIYQMGLDSPSLILWFFLASLPVSPRVL
uniref:Uncharacterized protein n=1 Tax=Picea glauca TaxID=3330 RepID=A0A101LTZ9_PICGL|nr:hypothetical protein ABT39_MTgene3413 [Picea glauca]